MSRFSEGDSSDGWELTYGRWICRVRQVLKGKPGQAALRDLKRALETLPKKVLIEGTLGNGCGVCANGAWLYRHWVYQGIAPRVAWRRLRSVERGEWHDWEDTGFEYHRTIEVTTRELGITQTLADLVAFENDEGFLGRGIEEGRDKARYNYMITWIDKILAGNLPYY